MLSDENKTNDTPLSREGASDITLSGDNLSDSGLSAGASLLGETPEVSMAVSRALADSLAKITAYVPTTWVDNTEPDIDAEHLNHVEQGIMRVTNLMNSAVDVIKDLQTQVTTLNGERLWRFSFVGRLDVFNKTQGRYEVNVGVYILFSRHSGALELYSMFFVNISAFQQSSVAIPLLSTERFKNNIEITIDYNSNPKIITISNNDVADLSLFLYKFA